MLRSSRMSTVDISNLPSILKDQSRRKVILALEHRGPLTYTEILNMLDTDHTGKLNYHLKVLGDLIAKDESTSRYSLTQKGELASQLLTQGFTSNGQSTRRKGLFDIGRVLTIIGAAFLLLANLSLAMVGGNILGVFFGTACPVALLAIGASVSNVASPDEKTKRYTIYGIPMAIVGFVAAIGLAHDLRSVIDPLYNIGTSISAGLGLLLALTGLILVLSYRNRATV